MALPRAPEGLATEDVIEVRQAAVTLVAVRRPTITHLLPSAQAPPAPPA
ncbi:MAG TPA: hypothetical protein VMJ30_05510 [Gemmatimonadales bacterium]|nr:hypothetical protein [Gemmatimonadales bacterium]